MAGMIIVEGFPEVLRGIRRKEAEYGRRIARGLKKAGVHLGRESEKVVPVDTGNLRAGMFIRHTGVGYNTVVSVGYVADYAVYVHEDLTMRHGHIFNTYYAADIAAGRHHPRRPAEQAKFLEMPLRRDRGVLAYIIRREAMRK